MATSGPFGAFRPLSVGGEEFQIADLTALEEAGVAKLDALPVSIKILLESVLRSVGRSMITEEDVRTAAAWKPTPPDVEIPFMPSRVLLQDFTGVPAIVDLATMRDAVAQLGGDPESVNPLVPCDLVIDHSIQVDVFGQKDAYARNLDFEYGRNRERYQLLRWAQDAFRNYRVVPPGTGICHQVNLEYLSQVVHDRTVDGVRWALPDTLVGMDSHTTMIGGIGVVGWGVGGIEAEAVMLGQPYFMKLPEVIGFRLDGKLPEGSTATDLVLTITEMLRKVGVVDKFVEFFGPGVARLSAQDRATIANMAPEQGSTISFFPVDEPTLEYLKETGRDPQHVARVREYVRRQGLVASDAIRYSRLVELDLSTVEPSLAGPSRPHDRVALAAVHRKFPELLKELGKGNGTGSAPSGALGRLVGEGGQNAKPMATGSKTGGSTATLDIGGTPVELSHGSVVISAITSCTNTSNPTVMLGAGILAKKALEAGLRAQPWVKTSMAPGSRVVTDYLERAGLLTYLEQLGFGVVAYGCTTCIGNAGPLAPAIESAIKERGLAVVSVLSGNRNFQARIHPLVRANYLASPPLVVAYALAGTVNRDLTSEPLGVGRDKKPVYLKDIWPKMSEIREAMKSAVDPELYRTKYASVFEGDERWKRLSIPSGRVYKWDAKSTYIRKPPFLDGLQAEPAPLADIRNARVLAMFGDSITTDHISPAGSIGKDTTAGRWLISQGVPQAEFNQYGARRGNHEVMLRGTFANVQIRNLLVPGIEGGITVHFPSAERVPIVEASERYRREGTPLVVLAGKEYGSGSSRDWAAKGPSLLGVRAVIATSFERIHRSNLIGMGVLPLQFEAGRDPASLGLTGTETFTIEGITGGLKPKAQAKVAVSAKGGPPKTFDVVVRLDAPAEIEYYRNGGIMPAVARRLLAR